MPQYRNDWRVTTALFAATSLVESLVFGHLTAFTPLFLEQLHVPRESVPHWTGWLSALAFVIGLPLLPFWGVWADRYGRKLMIVRSSVVAAVISAGSAASSNVWWLALTRLLGGFVFGNTGIMMALQADVTPRERIGGAVALISAGAPVGMAIGPYLGGQIVERWGIRALLYGDAVFTMVMMALLIIFLHDEDCEPAVIRSTREGVVEALRHIRHTPNVAPLFLVVFLLSFGVSGANPFAPILIERLHHGPDLAATIGLVLSGAGIAMAIATPFWGHIGDRVGHLRVLRACAMAVAASLAGQALAGSVTAFGTARLVQGLFQGGLGALAVVLLALYTPRDRRSSVLNLSLLPQQFAWFLGPAAASGVAGVSITLPMWIGAASVAAGGLLSIRLPVPEVEKPGDD